VRVRAPDPEIAHAHAHEGRQTKTPDRGRKTEDDGGCALRAAPGSTA
jgi:hypothetical protein